MNAKLAQFPEAIIDTSRTVIGSTRPSSNAKRMKKARQALRIARIRGIGPEWVALVLGAAGLSFKQMRSAVKVVLRRNK